MSMFEFFIDFITSFCTAFGRFEATHTHFTHRVETNKFLALIRGACEQFMELTPKFYESERKEAEDFVRAVCDYIEVFDLDHLEQQMVCMIESCTWVDYGYNTPGTSRMCKMDSVNGLYMSEAAAMLQSFHYVQDVNWHWVFPTPDTMKIHVG
jgi:hypothetical protein